MCRSTRSILTEQHHADPAFFDGLVGHVVTGAIPVQSDAHPVARSGEPLLGRHQYLRPGRPFWRIPSLEGS
jgi:hypothetical protein